MPKDVAYNSEKYYKEKIEETQLKIDKLKKDITRMEKEESLRNLTNLSSDEILDLLPASVDTARTNHLSIIKTDKYYCRYEEYHYPDEDEIFLFESESDSFRVALLGTLKQLIDNKLVKL